MTLQETEDLFIRSLDQPLSVEEKAMLVKELRANAGLATDLSQHKRIRDVLLRSQAATFGPYFSKKVITKIQNLGIEIDRQIAGFFKKYQLVALGVLIALLAVNAVFSDKFSITSVLGIQDTTATDDGIVAFDFYENLNN